MNKAILYENGTRYLAPELLLLYKSTDTERDGYQQDFELSISKMSQEQKQWLNRSLKIMNPDGHKWLEEN